MLEQLGSGGEAVYMGRIGRRDQQGTDNSDVRGNPQDDLRACNVQLVYNVKEETLKILDAALEEFDPETGEAVDAPFGNPDWVDEISLEMNSDEVAYIQENLEMILSQIEENKK